MFKGLIIGPFFFGVYYSHSLSCPTDSYKFTISGQNVYGKSIFPSAEEFPCYTNQTATAQAYCARPILVSKGLVCHRASTGVDRCRKPDVPADFMFTITTNQTSCYESPPDTSCDKKGDNGGLIWSDRSDPYLCAGSCKLSKAGTRNNLFLGGHNSSGGSQTIYTYTGDNCEGNEYPQIDPTSEETGQGESCTQNGDIKMCNGPDIDGDGLPEYPQTDELQQGCMSITVLSTQTSTVVCGDPNKDGQQDDESCGITADGKYGCYPNNECIFKNGKPICITDTGDYTGTDSPDHPLNGGNLDGNNDNDILDPSTVITQPALTDDQLINNENQSQNLSEKLAPYLVNIDNSVKTNGEKIDASNVLLTSIASGITNLNDNISNGTGGTIVETGTPTDTAGFDGEAQSNQFFIDYNNAVGDSANPNVYGESMGDQTDFKNKLSLDFNKPFSALSLVSKAENIHEPLPVNLEKITHSHI